MNNFLSCGMLTDADDMVCLRCEEAAIVYVENKEPLKKIIEEELGS